MCLSYLLFQVYGKMSHFMTEYQKVVVREKRTGEPFMNDWVFLFEFFWFFVLFFTHFPFLSCHFGYVYCCQTIHPRTRLSKLIFTYHQVLRSKRQAH